MDTSVDKYRALYPQYSIFADRFKDLINQLLQTEHVRIHFVESRAKSVESFAAKIVRPGKHYSDPLLELPDLIGIRLVLYYLDDVSRLGALLKREFEVIEEESSHQPAGYMPDQFGYLSMHYVVRLNPLRRNLPEWRDCATLHAEIQVRTVLQHAWAAVSHALQYKQEGDVPIDLRRRLFRLAGLFEIADEEFVSIRDAATTIDKNVKVAFAQGSKNIVVDAASIQEFIKQWQPLKKIRLHAEEFNFEFDTKDDIEDGHDYIGEVVSHCERLGLKTIGDLEKQLSYDPHNYLKTIMIKNTWYVSDGFLLFLLIIGARPKDFTIEILGTDGWNEEIAKRVISGAKKQH